MTKKGQVAAIVTEAMGLSYIVTYTLGESRIRVFTENGKEEAPSECPHECLQPAEPKGKSSSPKGGGGTSTFGGGHLRKGASPKPAPKQYRLSPKPSARPAAAAGIGVGKKKKKK